MWSASLCLSCVRVSVVQLDLITDLLGTPSLEAMRTACEGAKAHILRGPHKQVLPGAGSGHPAPPGRVSSGQHAGFHILIKFPWPVG